MVVTAADDVPAARTPASTPATGAPTAGVPGPTRQPDATAGSGAQTGHGTDAGGQDQGDPRLQAVTAPRGGETPFPAPTASAAAPTAPSGSTTANAPAPLAQQLARPVFTLAQAGPGEHVVTVQVSPDALGPVTVRAHVTAHGMHVELFASSDAGRDAVRQVLPDLRRDAAGSGPATTLDLSSQNQPDTRPGQDGRPAPPGPRLDAGPEARRTTPAPGTTHTPTVRAAGLDVLA